MKISSHRFRECLTTRTYEGFFSGKSSKWETTNTVSSYCHHSIATPCHENLNYDYLQLRKMTESISQHVVTSALLNCKRIWRPKHKVIWSNEIRCTHSESLKTVLRKGEILHLREWKKTKQMKRKLGTCWLESAKLKLKTEIIRSCNLPLLASNTVKLKPGQVPVLILDVHGENYLI